MDNRKMIALGIVTISIFIFLVTVLVFVFALYSEGQPVPDFLHPFMDYHIHFMVLMGLFGVGSGLLLYSIMSSGIEKERKLLQTNTGIIMKFLGQDERSVMELMLGKEGMTTQSEIARQPGMSRLKAHRIVKKLESRGIVHVEKYGKINMGRVVEELRSV